MNFRCDQTLTFNLYIGNIVMIYTDSDLERMLAQISGIDKSHSGRTLRDHLCGTYRILKEWSEPQHVCLAGLFHSIYGTEYFMSTLTLNERAQVEKMIGPEAEKLVYFFCMMSRRSLYENFSNPYPQIFCRQDLKMIEIELDTLMDLMAVAAANLIEQWSQIGTEAGRNEMNDIFRNSHFMRPVTRSAFLEFFHRMNKDTRTPEAFS